MSIRLNVIQTNNASEKVEEGMNVALATVKWQHAPVYISYISLILQTLEERLQHIEGEIKLTENAEMAIKLKTAFSIMKA